MRTSLHVPGAHRAMPARIANTANTVPKTAALVEYVNGHGKDRTGKTSRYQH
jgi:hypothetical protein